MAAEVLVWRAGWMRRPFPETEDTVAEFCLGGRVEGVVGRIMPSHILIPGTCKYAILYGRIDSVGVIKLRKLRWGTFLGLSRWAQRNHKGPQKREAGVSELATRRCYLLPPSSRRRKGP